MTETYQNHFFGKLVVEDIDGHLWRLHDDFGYVAKDGTAYYVPKGFLTDFASVPPVLDHILFRTGEYDRAAVIHDRLYQTHNTLGITRKRADDILLEAMDLCAVNWVQKQVIYWGVRIGGWAAWNSYDRVSA